MQTAVDSPGRVRSLALIGSAGLGPEINSGHIDAFVTAGSAPRGAMVKAGSLEVDPRMSLFDERTSRSPTWLDVRRLGCRAGSLIKE
jgi:hypothetical protein